MRFTSLRRTAVLTIVAAALAGTTACFGSFNLTRKVYSWNKGISENRMVQTLVFWGLNIVPVYNIAGAVDLLILNAVEMWTGTNPMAMASRNVELDKNTHVEQSMEVKDGVRQMTLNLYKDGVLSATTEVRHVEGSNSVSFQTRYANGMVESHVATQMADGSNVLTLGAFAAR